MPELKSLEEYHGKRVDPQTWKSLFKYSLNHRGSVLALCVTAILTGATDAAFPMVTLGLIDELTARGLDAVLWPYGLAFFGLLVTLCVCVAIFIVLAGRLSTHVAHDIREAGFARLQELSFSYYDQRPVGWLMARMTSDCDRLARILAWGLLDITWGSTVMISVVCLMLWHDWRLALITLSIVPLLAWVSMRFQRVLLKSARTMRKTNSRLTASYNESIMALQTTKAMVREQDSLGEFQKLSGEMHGASVRNALQSALYLPLVLVTGSIGTALALWNGSTSVLAGEISLGTLVAFMYWASMFFNPIEEIAGLFANLQMAQASAERVVDLIATEPDVQDSPEVLAAIAAQRAQPKKAGVAIDGGPEVMGELRLKDMSFRYKTGEPVLQGINLTVEAGETIALVGPTGGGKTTLASVICRFYEPTEGGVLIDGVDYRDRALEYWQSQIGVVLQEPHLFSGSVRENIRYGKLDASDEQIRDAARLVGADEFITNLTDGYDSDVGEGGNMLSTGQKQLVSFARALISDPQLLVMDEATSSIDAETERRMQEALLAVMKGRTCFVIAHRLSTIRAADRILLIEGGQILEQGSHAELLALQGRYHGLYLQQQLVGPDDGVGGGAVWSQDPLPS